MNDFLRSAAIPHAAPPSFEECMSYAARLQLWTASLSVAVVIGGEPEDQAQNALKVYAFAREIAQSCG